MNLEIKKRPGMLGGDPVFSAVKDQPAFGRVSSVSEYSMLDAALQLGARVISIDEGRGYACPPGREEAGQPQAAHATRPVEPQGATGAGGALADWRDSFDGWLPLAGSVLSTTHNRPAEISKEEKKPFFEYYEGASIFKVSKGGICEQIGGGVRNQIKGYSYSSRRRYELFLGSIRKDADLPAFVTLTYGEKFPTEPGVFKRDLATLIKRLRRKFHNDFGMTWKLEPQKRGAPHYHLLIWGCDLGALKAFIPFAWHEIAGYGDTNHLFWHLGALGNGNKHCVEPARSIMGYVSKYVGKSFENAGFEHVGRFWGVVNRQNIPVGEKKTVEVSLSKAVLAMRYQRRFVKSCKSKSKAAKRHKSNGRSKTIFCDASQWINRLL